MNKRGRKPGKKPAAPGKGSKIEKKLAEIGLKVHKARTRRGLSVLELSEMCGIAVPQIYMIEKGTNCTLKTLLKVRNALRIHITL